MKKYHIIALALLMLSVQSCTTGQFAGTTTGGFLGGMVGSAIGGIMGGPRGRDAGVIIGAATGAAIGAAATAPKDQDDRDYRRSYPSRSSQRGQVVVQPREYGILDIANVEFDDYNRNGILESGEPAYLIVDIYNRSNRYVSDITPRIRCSNSSVSISSSATILGIEPGQGIRYRASIRSPRRLRNGSVSFRIELPDGTTRSFSIRTRR